MEKCKVCKNSDCTGDSLDIIQNACTDSTQLGCPEFSFATICLSVLVFFVIHFEDLILSRTSSEKLSTFMSTPLSTSTVTNEYINSINSEFNYQLAEMTLFQFPNSDKCKFLMLITSIFLNSRSLSRDKSETHH